MDRLIRQGPMRITLLGGSPASKIKELQSRAD